MKIKIIIVFKRKKSNFMGILNKHDTLLNHFSDSCTSANIASWLIEKTSNNLLLIFESKLIELKLTSCMIKGHDGVRLWKAEASEDTIIFLGDKENGHIHMTFAFTLLSIFFDRQMLGEGSDRNILKGGLLREP